MAKKKQIDKQFKIDAVNYRKHHPELTMAEVANNLGISLSSIHRCLMNWYYVKKKYHDSFNNIIKNIFDRHR